MFFSLFLNSHSCTFFKKKSPHFTNEALFAHKLYFMILPCVKDTDADLRGVVIRKVASFRPWNTVYYVRPPFTETVKSSRDLNVWFNDLSSELYSRFAVFLFIYFRFRF